ncbi:unnamed protein product [Enterobius vermicularis]|uniref:Vps16_C domain-containing protein n=1 Tax=Enterobius vermicularis TaxID=51028 RepID=A0A0N4V8N3_ENTVE|nr:unnamed protein product [Enterobius vermicularis]
MAAHKKFNFDDPEDSYWNTSGTSTSEFFEDPPLASNAVRSSFFPEEFLNVEQLEAAARAALEDLFESQVRFGADDLSSNADSELPTDDGNNLLPYTADVGRLSLNADRRSRVEEKVAAEKCAKPHETGVVFPVKSAASIISEGSVGSFSNELVSQADYARLKSEHRRLQRYLEQLKRERYTAADPEVTVRRLRNGEPVTLDLYRSKKEKLELLSSALDSLDGNAINAVILFLKRTFSESLFREVLLENVVAADHYLSLLKQLNDYSTLAMTLSALGRHEEASMVEFSMACRQHTPEQKVQRLKKCLISSFSSASLNSEAKIVNEYIDLLERQIPIDAADNNDTVLASSIFTRFPKTKSIVGETLRNTLHYCCLYHYDLPVNAFASPLSIKELFHLNDREFIWTAVSALSRLARWADIEQLLTSRKLLGGNKIFCPFAWRYLFQLLTAYETPPKELLCRFLRAVPDIDERKKLAGLYPETADVVIECMITQKDRLGLGSFISKLAPHGSDAQKVQGVLKDTVCFDL